MKLRYIFKKAGRYRSIPEIVELVWKRSIGMSTQSLRMLPDFIIIGAQKCGTTSLFNYLSQHPELYLSYPKECHFFSRRFNRGTNWYQSHFPLTIHKEFVVRFYNHRFLTGEATPNYFIYPYAPERILNVVPDVRLIVLLRNPVDRAYSHYYMSKRMGFENLSFSEALDKEHERLSPELEKMEIDENYRSSIFLNFSYLSRGIYIEHLIRWVKFFERDRMLVINSSDFYKNPQVTIEQIEEFLGISKWNLKEYKRFASGNYTPMDMKTRKRLQVYFKPHNQRLYDYLGVDFGWEN